MSDEARKPRFPIGQGARRLVGRLGHISKDIGSRVWNHLWLAGGLMVVVVGLAVGLSIAIPWQFVSPPREVTVEMALEALDAGNLEAARAIADTLRLRDDLAPAELGIPSYILGVVLAREMEGEWRRKEHSGLQALATGYLEESRALGFPPDRAASAELLLGKLHFDEGHFALALPPLKAALIALPEQTSTIHRYLADAYLRSADPDWRQAQSHLESLLKDTELDADLRGHAELDLARVHFERADLPACDAVLAGVREQSPTYPAALMLRGRVFMAEADAISPEGFISEDVPADALVKYQEAGAILEQLVTKIARDNELIRQAKYLRAICELRQGNLDVAEAQLVAVRRGNFNSHEGLAAALAYAELQQSRNRDDEASVSFRGVVTQASELEPYENRWIPLTQLRKRLELAHQKFLDNGLFEKALAIAEGMASLVPPERSVELLALAERDWAKKLDVDVEAGRLATREALMSQARATWIRAGQHFEHLGRLRFSTRQFPEDVWDSAECYFHGHDYERTAKLLKLYMENETRRKRPPALTLLGQSQLALGHPDEALKWLMECIQFFPKDPYSYRARIVAAKANQELGKLEAAKQLLIGNLEHEALTPRSQEWRESKYALGRIFYQQGVNHEAKSRLKGVQDPDVSKRKEGLRELELAHDAFQQAIRQLEEAVQRDELAGRDPLTPETLDARYVIAESHRQSAKFARRKLPTITIETTRTTLTREMKQELEDAAEIYLELQLAMNRKQEQDELTPLELQLLRNCYFARADALYDLEKYDLARKAYSTATNRYQHEPESLEAYVQIANCHRHENRPEDARGTLELAKVVLERIPPDVNFNKTTRYTRDEWAELLDWLTAL